MRKEEEENEEEEEEVKELVFCKLNPSLEGGLQKVTGATHTLRSVHSSVV